MRRTEHNRQGGRAAGLRQRVLQCCQRFRSRFCGCQGCMRCFADRDQPKFSAKQVTFIVGILVSLLLASMSCFIFLAAAKAQQERLPCSPVPSAAVPCPIPWVGYGKRCYFFSATEANWTHSRNHCASHGGSLVTMQTAEERDFVKRLRERTGYWIGLQREDLHQPWIRPDGSLLDKSFPIRGEGLCAYLSGQVFSSTWCANTRYWICSKPTLCVCM